MDLDARIKELEEKKARLLKKQDDLISQIKTRHPEFYAWAVQHRIDFTNLAKYAANIAAAFAIIMTPGNISIQWVPDKAQAAEPTPIVKVIEVEELRGKTEDEKAAIVKERYGPIIEDVSDKYNIDPNIIFATIMIESGGNTYAVRSEPSIGDASYGLGQILYGTARGIGYEGTPEGLFNPETNIDLIGKYHRRNLDVYGGNLTPQQLTTAYNAGSPYNTPYPGHIAKFDRWFEKLGNLMV